MDCMDSIPNSVQSLYSESESRIFDKATIARLVEKFMINLFDYKL